MAILTRLATDTTLRYVLNLISCAQMHARKRKAEAVGEDDVRRAYEYFFDEKRSVQFIQEEDTLVTELGVDDKDSSGKTKPASGDAMDES